MAEVNEEFYKVISNENMAFNPDKNSCTITFRQLDLSQGECTTLTWLMMNGPELIFELKRKSE